MVSESTFFFVPGILAVLAVLSAVGAEYESAGCSDQGCGIPCYLRPPQDDCHYEKHDPCGDGGGATDLEMQLYYLNDSLVRLQEKLIQKNIIPAGTSCPSLTTIDHGGVIYSDLILSIGVQANYVCFNGYSLHGHGTYECSSDNKWIRTDNQFPWKDTTIPTCEDSVVECEALVPIPSGHISYRTVDTNVVQPGDAAEYSCDTLYKLQGDNLRICLRNGTWSGSEPVCIAPPTEASTDALRKDKNNKGILVAEVLVPIVAVVTVITIIAVGVAFSVRRRKTTRDSYTVLAENVDLSGRGRGLKLLKEEKECLTQPSTIKPESL